MRSSQRLKWESLTADRDGWHRRGTSEGDSVSMSLKPRAEPMWSEGVSKAGAVRNWRWNEIQRVIVTTLRKQVFEVTGLAPGDFAEVGASG